jgi:hypothetical protein
VAELSQVPRRPSDIVQELGWEFGSPLEKFLFDLEVLGKAVEVPVVPRTTRDKILWRRYLKGIPYVR